MVTVMVTWWYSYWYW